MSKTCLGTACPSDTTQNGGLTHKFLLFEFEKSHTGIYGTTHKWKLNIINTVF